jgi:1,2-diacylglycerol 3-alpha-glucosyltransferase
MDKKFRIVLVTNNWEPYAGGLVSSLRMYCSALQNLGHKVVLITLDFHGKKVQDPYFVKRIYCPFRFTYKKNIMAVPWASHWQLEQLINVIKPDIIHVQHPFLLGVSALKIAKERNISVVFTHHSMYTAFAHYIPLPGMLTRSIIRILVNRFCSSVDGIIVPSTRIKTLLEQQHITTPIHVIMSAIQPIFLQQEKPLAVPSHREKPFKLLYVGRFTKEKNTSFILDVFAQLPKKSFCLTLAGHGYAQNGLMSYAYDFLGLTYEDVVFLDRPSTQDLAYLYHTSDLFLFSGKNETQGIVFAEAMAAGLPIIAVDGPGQQDIIYNGFNGFIIFDKKQMIEKIMDIFCNNDLHALLKHNAYQTGIQYTPERMGKQLIDFYKKFIPI